MKNRRRFPAVFLLIVLLGGICCAHAEDSAIRSPFSGRTLQQVQEDKPDTTTSSGISETRPGTTDGMGSGEDTATQIKDLKQKTVSVLTNTLRTIIDILRRLIEQLKKFLAGQTTPQPSESPSSPTTTAAPADDSQNAPDTSSDQKAEPAVTPEPTPEPAPEQTAVPDSPVAPEPASQQPAVSEPSAEPPASSSETAAPPEPLRGPSPAECERMRLLISDGKIEEASALLDKGFDINARIGEKGTALHYAVENGQNGIVELLLKRGADTGVRADRNTAPLHIAAASKNAEACRLLIEAGADVNITGSDGTTGSDRTPLHLATEWGAIDVLKLLIAKGANVNALDSRKQTPLAWAIFSGQAEAASILREHGGVTDPAKIPTDTPR